MRVFTFLVMCGLLVPLAGCGSSKEGTPVKVSGKVTMNGEPVANAKLTFHSVEGGLPPDKRTVMGSTDKDGRYTLPTVYVGSYKVAVEKPGSPDSASQDKAKTSAIPDLGPYVKYQLGNTPLNAAVAKGQTTFDFDLKKDGT